MQISGKRARCSLSKLVTDGIFHVQKIVTCWWGMHPPHPPPLDPPLEERLAILLTPKISKFVDYE